MTVQRREQCSSTARKVSSFQKHEHHPLVSHKFVTHFDCSSTGLKSLPFIHDAFMMHSSLLLGRDTIEHDLTCLQRECRQRGQAHRGVWPRILEDRHIRDQSASQPAYFDDCHRLSRGVSGLVPRPAIPARPLVALEAAIQNTRRLCKDDSQGRAANHRLYLHCGNDVHFDAFVAIRSLPHIWNPQHLSSSGQDKAAKLARDGDEALRRYGSSHNRDDEP